jgi:uncharacterized protein (DUF362 family)
MGLQTERRDFLKQLTSWLPGIWGRSRSTVLSSFSALESFEHDPPQGGRRTAKSTVVICRNDRVRPPGGVFDNRILEGMVNSALQRLTGATSPSAAWGRFVTARDVVGIKVNCLAGRGLSTHPELVEVIVKGLRSAGIPEGRIIIWDRMGEDLQRAGYSINVDGGGIRCYGTDAPGADYERGLTVIGSVGSRLSRILTKQCTAVINVPVLKDHSIAGLSVGLKNYFGAIDNPNKYHQEGCNPYIADLCTAKAITSKNRLILCDALTAQYEGGPPYMPQWAWPFNGIIAGTDPVAVDQVAYGILDEKRKEKGLPSLADAGREPVYLATAADERHRLGTNDPQDIDVVRIS